MKTVIERWKSNRGEREDHYHIDDKRRVYLFGYNPKMVTKEQVKAIKKILNL